MAKAKDYTMYINMKFGKLTIQNIVRRPKKVIAECVCDCGNTTEGTVLARLISGDITQCKKCSNQLNGNKGRQSRSASSKYNYLIGKKIHCFTILRRSNETEPCGTFQCQCICGNIRFLDAYELTISNDRKSCGCQQSRFLSLGAGGNGVPHSNETVNEFLRKSSSEYKTWVRQCLETNQFTCFVSGQIGGTLNVHHLIPLKTLIDLYQITKTNYINYTSHLFDLSNGVVLTEAIHKQLHLTYGREVSINDIIAFKTQYLNSLKL